MTFFVPIILIMYTSHPIWIVYPVPQYPYKTMESCETALMNAKHNLLKMPHYRQGIGSCVEIKAGDIT